MFARTKHGADRLAKKLAHEGLKTATIHGDRSQNQRTQALKGFQDGYYRVLVATDVAARGIHVEGISHVVNYDLPQVAEDFIHRVGPYRPRGRKRNRFHLRYPRRALGCGPNRTAAGRETSSPASARRRGARTEVCGSGDRDSDRPPDICTAKPPPGQTRGIASHLVVRAGCPTILRTKTK